MRIVLFIFIGLTLNGCSHPTLKAPCKLVASIADNPCNPVPLNYALNQKKTGSWKS